MATAKASSGGRKAGANSPVFTNAIHRVTIGREVTLETAFRLSDAETRRLKDAGFKYSSGRWAKTVQDKQGAIKAAGVLAKIKGAALYANLRDRGLQGFRDYVGRTGWKGAIWENEGAWRLGAPRRTGIFPNASSFAGFVGKLK